MFAKDPRNTWAYWERQKYCSQTCAGLARTAEVNAARPPMREEFARFFIPDGDGCWPWIGHTDKDGYGLFVYAGKQYRAPRIALELDGRAVPKGHYACHHCDNPLCVNPAHLYVGTPSENVADMINRGRFNRGRRTRLTETDVREIRSASGTHDEIAARFGISRPAVSMIRSRKTWGHVQ